MLEKSLLVEAKRSAKQQTLKYFLAKRLQSMISQINRATIQMHDSFKINYESNTDVKKRISRLKTMKRLASQGTSIRKSNQSQKKKAKFSKRKSIMLLFGDTRINQVIFEQDEEDSNN